MKLISMTDFVLGQNKKADSMGESFYKCINYANFLKQPLELWMFVPCDENNVPLEEPKWKDHYMSDGFGGSSLNIKDVEQYQQAKERVFF